MSIPLMADATVFGMITLDAPLPGDLDETDVPVVEVLATSIAAAYAAAQR